MGQPQRGGKFATYPIRRLTNGILEKIKISVTQLRSTDIAASEAEDTVGSKKRDYSLRGRAGGLKGGKARAKQLTAKERKRIAKKAAETRWKQD